MHFFPLHTAFVNISEKIKHYISWFPFRRILFSCLGNAETGVAFLSLVVKPMSYCHSNLTLPVSNVLGL